MPRTLLLLPMLTACSPMLVPGSCATQTAVDLASMVGHREVVLASERRSVDLNVWYPTSTHQGRPAKYRGFVPDRHTVRNAPLQKRSCRMPLVVYSHGSHGYGGEASTLLRQLVGAGWLAVAPDHTGDTVDARYWYQQPEDLLELRVADVQRSIDFIETLPPEDPLYGRVDTDRVLVVGREAGAETAWWMAGPALADAEPILSDERIIGSVPMAGHLPTQEVAREGYAEIGVPVLSLTGTADDDVLAAIDHASGTPDLTWIEVEGACRTSFTDLDLPCPTLDKDEGLTRIASHLIDFAASTVRQTR